MMMIQIIFLRRSWWIGLTLRNRHGSHRKSIPCSILNNFLTEQYRHLLGCSEADAHSQALEVRRTWTFLFQSTTTTWKQKAVRRAYHALPTPSWLHFYLDHPSSDSRTKRKHPNLGHILKLYPPMISYELSQHQHRGLFRYNFFKRGRFDYALFPQYGKRIRDSREYMDKSKPSSFVDVTRDRRDTVVYWTFISVVAFGVLSLLLSALGLAAGIVQAWASVRGMG